MVTRKILRSIFAAQKLSFADADGRGIPPNPPKQFPKYNEAANSINYYWPPTFFA
jgi:hypothetical protein